MEQIVKKEFTDLPDETTPFESEWFNSFQDKIIANFSNCLFFVEDTSNTSTNASTESEE